MIELSTITKGVNSVIDLIQKFLPLIPAAGSAAPVINSVVDTLQEISPLVIDQIGTTYTGVKNIINALSSHPDTTSDQLKRLREFDKQVDDAWNEIESELDPDAPGGDE